MDQEIEVPQFFICPISLEIMRDPVTVSTGITYDRESIEKWLYSSKSNTCPVTKQDISEGEITPNHTLRRLIQSWCTLNASHGIERIPTPKPVVSRSEVEKLIKGAKSHHQTVKCLRKLRPIASENATNRRCIESAGAVEFLASLISSSIENPSSAAFDDDENANECLNLGEDGFESSRSIVDDALGLLYQLQISESGLKNLLNSQNGVDIIKCLTRIMQHGIYESRTYALFLMKSVLEVADPVQLISLKPELFTEIVQILHDHISHQASKSALQILINVCPWGRNRHKAVDAGVVSALVELLLDCASSERRFSEMALVVLDLVCQCAEGRAELLGHGAGVAVVSKKVLRVSRTASERAVKVLLSVGKYCANPALLQEMLQLGVVAKLCLVLQVDCGSKIKEKARELLKLHARVWKSSPCIPTSLLASYPG